MAIYPTNILGSFEVAKRALLSHQTVINTVGHNLANAATPGYSRQRAELVALAPRHGVDVAMIQRVRDRFLDFSLLTEQQEAGRIESEDGILQRLQAVVNDPPGTGLSAVLDQLFQGFQDLSIRPADQALRVTVRDAADRVGATFRGLRARLDQLKTDLNTEIQARVGEANRLLAQIADLHRQIALSAGGPPPNDLFDQRDQLVTRLAHIIGISVQDRTDGSVRIDLAGTGVFLLEGQDVKTLTAIPNPGADTVDLAVGGLTVTPRSGALAGALEARNSTTGAVKQAASDLDGLARAVIAEVNRLHASGSGLVGYSSLAAGQAVSAAAAPLDAAGLPFTPGSGSFRVIAHDATGAVVSDFTVTVTAGTTTLDDVRAAIDADPNLTATISGGALTVAAGPGTTFTFASDTSDTLMALGLNTLFAGSSAATIGLAPPVAADVNRIAAARADAAGLVHPGDGANALAIARLRTQPTMNGGTDTFVGFYGTLVSRIGSRARDAAEGLERQRAAVQVVEGLQQQVSGVSTDEELIALTRSQHAYAAAARFATTIDDILETLLSL